MGIEAGRAISVLLYITLIFFWCFAIYMERRDSRCSNPTDGKSHCSYGHGVAYAAGKPHSGDSLSTLLDKIRLTSRYETNSIIWRRAFIIAVISAFLVLYIYKKRLPSGIQLTVAFLVIYIVTYLALTCFQKLITEPALGQMDELIRRVRLEVGSK